MLSAKRFLGPLLVALTLVGAVPAQAADLPEIKVFAAASTTDAVNEIGRLYAEKAKLVPSYASSSTLARQIENGAPADIFISADEQWADYLQNKNLLAPGSRVSLLGNRLALIAPVDSKVELGIVPNFPLATQLKDGRLSVGDPDHVPVGIYTKQALTNLGVWDQVSGKLARGDSVRAALAYVERGECPLGIVYTTDAAIDPKVRIVAVFPESSHPPIVYPAALVAGRDSPAAKAFLQFLQGPEAKDVFQKYGFLIK